MKRSRPKGCLFGRQSQQPRSTILLSRTVLALAIICESEQSSEMGRSLLHFLVMRDR